MSLEARPGHPQRSPRGGSLRIRQFRAGKYPFPRLLICKGLRGRIFRQVKARQARRPAREVPSTLASTCIDGEIDSDSRRGLGSSFPLFPFTGFPPVSPRFTSGNPPLSSPLLSVSRHSLPVFPSGFPGTPLASLSGSCLIPVSPAGVSCGSPLFSLLP